MGRIVTLVTSSSPETLWTDNWPMLLGMAVVLLLLRPLAQMAQNLVSNQAIAVNVANMIRWQNHFHVARQSWAFFQNDFAGRIANRVMQTGPAVRESLVALITGVWYIMVYGTAAPTMDAIDSFKVQALDSMAATIGTLETEVTKSRAYLDRVERQDQHGPPGSPDLGDSS